MDTYFNLNRIGCLLRADWIEHRKSLLLCLGGVALVWIALLYFNEPYNANTSLQKAFFFIGGFVTFIYYCRFTGKKIHQPKGLYYTLPAGNEEKYFTLLLEGFLFFLAFAGIFWSGLLLFSLFTPDFSMIGLSELYQDATLISLLLLLSSVIFLSYITFRKFALLIGVTGIVLYVSVYAGIWIKILDHRSYLSLLFTNWEAGVAKQAGTQVLLVAAIVVLYIGYLKLKEKELR
jgi:hypothetical protein